MKRPHCLPLAMLLALSPAPALACGESLGPGTLVAASPRYEVAFRADPPLAVSRHVALDIVVCAKPGAKPARLTGVDARMPAHGHGMNYRPSMTERGTGRYRAEGLLLHMPGEWEFRFALSTADGGERALLRRDVQ